MHGISCCDGCTVLAARELQDVFAQTSFDHRVASLVVLLVQRLVDRLTSLQTSQTPSTPHQKARHTLTVTSQDSQLAQVFGSEDACKDLHQGSRYWAVLAAVSRHLQRSCGVAVWFHARDVSGRQEGCSGQQGSGEQLACCASSTQQEGASLQQNVMAQQQAGTQEQDTAQQEARQQDGRQEQEQEQDPGQQGVSQHDGPAHPPSLMPASQPEATPTPTACPFCNASGGRLALELSWHRHQRACIARSCGALLLSWFPHHASALSQRHARLGSKFSTSSLLEAQSQAARQALRTTILGTQEQQLAVAMLQLQDQGLPPPPALQALCMAGSSSSGLQPSAPIAAALAALPFLVRVEWKPFGRWEFQGSAFVTLTNGSGVFLCVCIRSVALVRTGGKARGLSLSWPGRFGQAAKAGRSVPGQAEDLAVKRRRQKRYGSAQSAVEYAAALQAELPEGSRLFAGVCTSALEGVQVAAAKSRDKAAQAALLSLLLGLPAAWPDDGDAPAAAAEARRCRRCGELMKSRKQRGKTRGHRCRKRDRSWLGGSWWSSADAWGGGGEGGGYTQGSVLLAAGAVTAAAALLYLVWIRRR